jgi:hypothetical protein
MAVKLLESALAKVGATSPIGDAVMKALNGLAKHIPPGTVSPAGEQNEIQNMAMRNVQQQGQVAAMRGAGGGGGPPGAGAGAG